ncbi:MAG: hypothetical protein IPM24_26165 [Bryobacterales bacterium]|nr:hypothetical protein [Bryobacterales bacterium]
MPHLSRRALLATAASAWAAPQASARTALDTAVASHDVGVARYLEIQVTDPRSRWLGAIPDAYGLHHGNGPVGALNVFITAFTQPKSRYYKDRTVAERIRLAAAAAARMQNEHGNFDLLTTNFNSPADTAFIVRSGASAFYLARQANEREFMRLMEPVLLKGAQALVVGGIHTPNHRWVLCGALAQMQELFPNPDYLRRINLWLAEGVDIDDDGQYGERSTLVYNPITNSALIAVAHKLNRPALLDPVRRNLDALMYLLHPNLEVVTEISRRQDRNQPGLPEQSWFALRYLAVKDGNGHYAQLASQLAPSLNPLMEYPELLQPGPAAKPLPDDYVKEFPSGDYAHIRRGNRSVTLLLDGNSRLMACRKGGAVVNAVRMAAAFFGKGQFKPMRAGRRGDSFVYEQELDAGYYQPFDPPRPVPAGEDQWYAVRPRRRRTEVCDIFYRASVSETPRGAKMRIEASGTKDVPVAIEINLRAGGKLEGVVEAPGAPKDSYILAGRQASYTVGGDTLRFGPGLRLNDYTQVRGAEPKLDGPSVYLTGYTPFDHTIEFDLA